MVNRSQKSAPSTVASAQSPADTFSSRAALYVGLLWSSFFVFLLVHGVMRGMGDELVHPKNIQPIEAGLFRVTSPLWLQRHVQGQGVIWLDGLCFAAYSFWFVLPLVLALAVTRKAPRMLMPFFAWVAVLTLITDAVFLAFPVTPPWMHSGVSRLLLERPFSEYAQADNNQFAAFPSLHAGLPLLFALFFRLYVPNARKLAWFCGVYALVVGFSVIYLGEHWVLDVLGGYAFAGLAAWLCLSPRMKRIYARIPGDPVFRLARLNERICTEPGLVEEPEPLRTPEMLPEAA